MSFIIGLLATLSLSYAAEPAHCTYLVERHEGTQFQRIWSETNQKCYMSVHPLNGYYDLIYRDHLFSTEGLYMIFNSFGKGDESSTTGAREYYLFPRLHKQLTHRWDFENHTLQITHITGDRFTFDSRKARLLSITRAHVDVADDIVPDNRGGVEIYDFAGLLLDGGWAMGTSPTSKRNNSSRFKDSQGQTCTLRNSDLFNYTFGGEVVFKYTNDSSLKNFLKSRCPKLIFR